MMGTGQACCALSQEPCNLPCALSQEPCTLSCALSQEPCSPCPWHEAQGHIGEGPVLRNSVLVTSVLLNEMTREDPSVAVACRAPKT